MLTPPFEARLRDRFVKLVEAHCGPSSALAAGVHGAPGLGASFAAAQAAFRFFNNPRVTLRGLAAPLLEAAREETPQACDEFVLVIHDWTPLSYGNHGSKKDRLSLSGRGRPEAYEALTALAVSDRDGLPIAPLSLSLRATDGVHCSRSWKVRKPLSPLDELDPVMTFVEKQKLGRRVVHLIDAEADSVGHYRQWSSKPERIYLVRGDDRLVEYAGRERKCLEIQRELREANQFRLVRDVLYHGQKARQYAAEIPVRLLRAAHRNRPHSGEREWMPGSPLALRLVICEVRGLTEELLATWILFSNAPPQVESATLAQWYYWRWSIEKFFKLLKSAGVHAEQWQQETAAAITRRLLVASMACVVVWRLARQDNPQAIQTKRLLIQLSGRQMKRKVKYTLPALFAGFWTLLTVSNVLNNYTPEELHAAAKIAFEKPP